MKKTFRVSAAMMFALGTLMILLMIGAYALAIIVLVKLFSINIWWGLLGLVAYLIKPKITIKR